VKTTHVQVCKSCRTKTLTLLDDHGKSVVERCQWCGSTFHHLFTNEEWLIAEQFVSRRHGVAPRGILNSVDRDKVGPVS